MIRNLGFEIYKNFKIIFRSWSSVSILILGPLLLILLIGYTFSGSDVHGIKIGIQIEDPTVISPLLGNITDIGSVSYYDDIYACLDDMMQQKEHLCLEFSDNFISSDMKAEDLPTGQIVFYYDNTRPKISSEIVDHISEALGVKAKEISLEGAQTILSNIESMVIFLSGRKSDIDSLVNESGKLRQDLVERKQSLVEFRAEFLPGYERIKKIQKSVDILSENIEESQDQFLYAMGFLKDQLLMLKSSLSGIEKNVDYYVYKINDSLNDSFSVTTNLSYLLLSNHSFENLNLSVLPMVDKTISLDNFTFKGVRYDDAKIDLGDLSGTQVGDISISLSLLMIDETIITLDTQTSLVNMTYSELIALKSEFDGSITELDKLKQMLDDEIVNTDEYIVTIDESQVRMKDIQRELENNLAELSRFNPSLADKLINPIIQSFEPLMQNLENIKLAFPLLLAQIILFISILFSNIVTQSELQSRAYMRNLIAPVNDLIYMFGLVVTNLLVVMFQLLVLLLVAQFKFGIPVFSMIRRPPVVSVLLSLIFIFAGMIIAYSFTNTQTSILSTTFISLAIFLFSDLITPLEIMPVPASILAQANPFVMAVVVFKRLILFGLPISSSSRELLFMTGLSLILLSLTMFVAKRANKNRV